MYKYQKEGKFETKSDIIDYYTFYPVRTYSKLTGI